MWLKIAGTFTQKVIVCLHYDETPIPPHSYLSLYIFFFPSSSPTSISFILQRHAMLCSCFINIFFFRSGVIIVTCNRLHNNKNLCSETKRMRTRDVYCLNSWNRETRHKCDFRHFVAGLDSKKLEACFFLRMYYSTHRL